MTLYHGDVLQVLRDLPAESVDCCVTSPPYWGLRDYGQEGQLGLELTPEEYVTRMVEVFREVRRVLAPHGTVWLNLGDSYNAGRSGGWAGGKGSLNEGRDLDAIYQSRSGPNVAELKPKDLVGVPWRVAFALQADGWYLRSDIIWAKPNPMPESVTDRPTKAHEYIFLLSKNPKYFFDQEAVREALTPAAIQRDQTPRGRRQNGGGSDESMNGIAYTTALGDMKNNPAGRNIRSVWEIATQPYPEAHFATFPEELARRCIAAGCPEQVCRVCGKARERIMGGGHNPYPGSSTDHTQDGVMSCGAQKHSSGMSAGTRMARRHYERTPPTTVGFTDCTC